MIRAGEFFVYWRGLVLVRHRRSFEVVERGNYEAIYDDMPAFGLAKATEHVRAVGGRNTISATIAAQASTNSGRVDNLLVITIRLSLPLKSKYQLASPRGQRTGPGEGDASAIWRILAVSSKLRRTP
jgi:hypothetical protein